MKKWFCYLDQFLHDEWVRKWVTKTASFAFFNLFFSSQRNPTVLIGAMKRYHKQVFIWKVTFFSEMNSWKSFWSSFSVSHMAWEVSVTRRMDYFVFFGLLNQSKFAQYYKNWHCRIKILPNTVKLWKAGRNWPKSQNCAKHGHTAVDDNNIN